MTGALLAAFLLAASAEAGEPPVIHVDRAGRTVYLLDPQGQILDQEPAGIGRGGLAEKVSMADLVTPTGTFTVNLVLSADGKHNAIAPELIVQNAAQRALLEGSAPGLTGLFANMSRLDFDGDGDPDGAYGSAYIGLVGTGGEVTGPGLRRYREGTPYWFSIALHGTPDPSNLGAANSGGCVHLSAALLARLLDEGRIGLGSTVTIADGPPP